jgi:hypothetical protein
MNSLPAIRNPLPRTELPPDVVKDIRGTPRPVREPVPPANPANQASYGEYLVTIAYCEECHTPQKKGGAPDISRRYASTIRTPAGKGGDCGRRWARARCSTTKEAPRRAPRSIRFRCVPIRSHDEWAVGGGLP